MGPLASLLPKNGWHVPPDRVFYDVCNVRLDTAEEKMAGFLDQNEKLKGKNVQISEFTTACSALFWCQNWWSICFFWGGGAGGSVWRINSLQRVVQHNRRQHCSVLSSIDERKISPMMPQRSSCIPSAGGLSVDPIESLIFFSFEKQWCRRAQDLFDLWLHSNQQHDATRTIHGCLMMKVQQLTEFPSDHVDELHLKLFSVYLLGRGQRAKWLSTSTKMSSPQQLNSMK